MNKNTVIQNVFLQCEKVSLRQPIVVIFKENIEINEKPARVNQEKDIYSLKNITGNLKKIKFEPIPFEKIGLKNH